MGTQLLAEVQHQADGTESRILKFCYDEKSSPIGFVLTDGGAAACYHFGKNLQGDVIGLYRWNWSEDYHHTMTLVATYDYDPWGRLLSITDPTGAEITGSTHPASLNPIRYRGYYYDSESGFYYLQSRYYDPALKRFINADSYASTGQGFLGHNMFAYCNNNPISHADHNGAILDAARSMLKRWLFCSKTYLQEYPIFFDQNSDIGKALKKSKKMAGIANKAVEYYKSTGNKESSGSGEFTWKEDGWDLYLSTQHFSYIAVVNKELETRQEAWSALLPASTISVTYERYSVYVLVIDEFNFDGERPWTSVGSILNNIAYQLHAQYSVGYDYEWMAEYHYATDWRRQSAF